MSFGGLLKANLSPVAVDFGVAGLKALQLSASGDAPNLVAAGLVPTPEELIDKPEERLAYQVDELPKLLRECGFKGKRAVCSVSATATLVQHFFTPNTGVNADAAIREQVRQITGRDPNQLILRNVEVGELSRKGVKGTETICIAMPRHVVLQPMQAFKRCKLETVGVHSEHLAAIGCFGALAQGEGDGDEQLLSLFVDLGYATTKIMLTKGKKLITARTLPLGGRDIDVRSARRTNGSPAAAHKARCALAAASDTGGVCAAVAAGVGVEGADGAGDEDPAVRIASIIADELELALRYSRSFCSDRALDRCVFFGGESGRADLCRGIARRLGTQAHLADPFGSLGGRSSAGVKGVDLDQPQGGWVVPMGMCMAPTDL